MKCDKCGMSLAGNESICPNCGNNLSMMQNSTQSNIQSNNVNTTNMAVTPSADSSNMQVNMGSNNNQVNAMGMQNYGQQMNNMQMGNQPMYINNQVGNAYNAPNNGNNDDKKKKAIIVGLMLVIIILLCVLVFLPGGKGGNSNRLSDGSRTIMIYMVGSNLESESKIATYDLDAIDPEEIDLEKTHVLLYTGGTEKWHNFVKNDENGLYELTEDGFDEIQSYSKKNMGSADTLQEFLDYGYSNYETQYYDLILYDHGGAIDGAIYDDFTKDNLSLADFTKALDNSKFNKDNKLNTVLFRTCLNGTIEVANVFAPYAEYLIASEEVTNGGQSSVLNFLNEVENTDDGISYGKKFIKAYDDQMQELDPFGMGTTPMYAIIDLSKVEKIQELLEEFISSVDLEENYSDIVKIRSKLYQYGYTTYDMAAYDTVDLYSLVDDLSKYSEKNADEIKEAIEEAVVYNWTKEDDSHGLSVYFPYNADKLIQARMLSIYKKMDADSPYYKFIGKFNNLSTSKKSSSFANNSISENKLEVSDNKEFSLQLTEEQHKDYATSIYMIFRKDEDGLYNPIYSSDNTELTDDGLLKTHISDNLIKIRDASRPDAGSAYLVLIERNKGGVKSIFSNAVLTYTNPNDYSDWKVTSATVYFDIKDNQPSIASVVQINSENGISGNILDINDYTKASFVASSYPLVDKNGNFTDNWNTDVVSAYEVDVKNLAFDKASLGDDEEYYCVFKIRDIYGNEYYSKVLSIK